MGFGPRPLRAAAPRLLLRPLLALRRFLLALARALSPSELSLIDLASGVAWTTLLGSAARHRLADVLGDRPRAAGELARELSLDEDVLHRMLRTLASVGVFRLERDGRFTNNRLSRALRDDALGQSAAFARYLAAPASLQAWMAFETSLRAGTCAFNHAHGQDTWSYFAAHPEDGATFGQAMQGLTVGVAPLISQLYPFREVGCVCDLGGGQGVLLSELLVRNPRLRGILCDAPERFDAATLLFQARQVEARVTLAPGNFFEAVPGGADCYLLKNILHDWGDARSVRLLTSVRRALPSGGRLLIVESFLPHTESRGLGPLSDVQMLVMCEDGRERSEQDYARLGTAAGLRVTRTFRSPIVDILELTAAV